MKTLSALMISLIILASCNYSIYYTQPQPAGKRDLNSFPKKLRGDYINNNNSTLCSLTRDQLNWKSKNDTICGTLSDSLILRKLHRNYLLNVRQNIKYHDKYLWHVYLISYNKKRNNIKISIIAEDPEQQNEGISGKNRISFITTSEGSRNIIDPSYEELEQLLTGNFFRLLYCFTILDNDKFLHIFALN